MSQNPVDLLEDDPSQDRQASRSFLLALVALGVVVASVLYTLS